MTQLPAAPVHKEPQVLTHVRVCASGPFRASLLSSLPSTALPTGFHLPPAPILLTCQIQPDWVVWNNVCNLAILPEKSGGFPGGNNTTSLTPTNFPDASLTAVESYDNIDFAPNLLRGPSPHWELWALIAFQQGMRIAKLDICIGPPSGAGKSPIFIIP